ncbi:MAG: hypothetical protein LV477_12530 [Candidatus Nitrosotalea sp.]|nr:hypothetical protein [Candidatus Nitrosotalea sp.]
MSKWMVILKALIIVALLLTLKVAIDSFDFDLISTSPIISGLVAGVIFTIAILFTGTLPDYKESEKIPGELAASIKSLYKDARISCAKDQKTFSEIQANIKELLGIINSNLKNKTWKLREINSATEKIEDNVYHLAQNDVSPNFISKMRTELVNIDRISNRVETIMETTFMPVAYLIADVAISLVILLLLFVKMDPYYEGITLFGAVSFLLISLMLLIRDMDDPFSGAIRVDLSTLSKLEERMIPKTQ